MHSQTNIGLHSHNQSSFGYFQYLITYQYHYIVTIILVIHTETPIKRYQIDLSRSLHQLPLLHGLPLWALTTVISHNVSNVLCPPEIYMTIDYLYQCYQSHSVKLQFGTNINKHVRFISSVHDAMVQIDKDNIYIALF